jgi:SsrA-binding protein
MAKKARKPASGDVATNRRARHKFELLDRVECGIELTGTEV